MPPDPAPREHHLTIQRTARYAMLGLPSSTIRDVWFVLHGYGQLARYFIQAFADLQDERRLIVAPEALSRFYLEGTSGRVGASWMTSADRRHEIGDYLAYLDALRKQVTSGLQQDLLTHRVLGFSQGAATAGRWAAQQPSSFDHLILWAGGLPPHIDNSALQNTDLTLVVGNRDKYVTEERLAGEERRLAEQKLSYRLIRYEGGHRIQEEGLAKLIGSIT